MSLTTTPLDVSTWPDFARLAEDHHGVRSGCWCLGFERVRQHHWVAGRFAGDGLGPAVLTREEDRPAPRGKAGG